VFPDLHVPVESSWVEEAKVSGLDAVSEGELNYHQLWFFKTIPAAAACFSKSSTPETTAPVAATPLDCQVSLKKSSRPENMRD